MTVLGSTVFTGEAPIKRLEVLHGDITAISPGDGVDILVVSAFPDDYTASSGSVVGALARRGVGLRELSRNPLHDFRSIWHAWISQEIEASKSLGFKHILIFEPEERPEDNIDALFRALLPVLGDGTVSTVATPLVGCGDQGGDAAALLPRLVHAAMHWLNVSPLRTLRIYEFDQAKASRMRTIFSQLEPELHGYDTKHTPPKTHDLFISYSHDDKDIVNPFIDAVRSQHPGLRVFRDEDELEWGADLYPRLDAAVRGAMKFVPMFSPSYVASNNCLREFHTALNLQRREQRRSFVNPLYIKETPGLDDRMKEIIYKDCTSKPQMLELAAKELVGQLKVNGVTDA